MKKFALLFAAMLTMAQISAANNDATVSNENAIPEVAATTVSADDDDQLSYQHPFKDDDESTKHWTVTTNGFYLGMGVKHSWEAINNSFEIGLLNIAAIKYNSLHGQVLTLGVGIHHKSYSVKRPLMLERGVGSQIVTVGTYPSGNTDEIKERSSNLNIWGLQFPLMFKQRIFKKLNVGVAGILNWHTYARVDNHYELNKVEHDAKYKNLNQEKIDFDFMGTLSWDDYGIYCRYSPGKVLKDGFGPEIKDNWSIGFILHM